MRLLIFIEPTSYILPLWREIKAHTNIQTRVIFLEENLSQLWNLNLCDDPNIKILHGNWITKLVSLVFSIGKDGVELVHLAGWGHPLLIPALLFAGVRRIPITIESDTQYNPRTIWWCHILKHMVFRVLFRIPTMFFPAGTRQMAYFVRYGVSQTRIRIAQMSVDVRSIRDQVDWQRGQVPAAIGIQKTTVFLYVGRLEIYKGIPDLLEAFVSLIKEGKKGHLIIVGDGSMRNLVESSVDSHKDIEYLGRLTGDELIDAYSRANVFVLPSHIEPWGLAINEAMAASLPVITTDRVGCVDDLVYENKNGFIVPSACPSRLADAMRTFIDHAEIAAAMGLASRQMISNWTIEDEARILMTTWDGLK